MRRRVLPLALGMAMAVPAHAQDPVAAKCHGHVRLGCRAATRTTMSWRLPDVEPAPEPAPTETLAEALDAAYRLDPALQAARWQLRAGDENYALALAETRPTTAVQVTGNYSKTVPGRITQATRIGAPSAIITGNTLAAEAVLTQPLTTGGRASADRDAARAQARAGREALRGDEGDTLLALITAYMDVRRDAETLRLYDANIAQLRATLEEVKARTEAGELTRTDIAQTETQVDAAESQIWIGRQQLEQDRAAFAALTGHDPRVLAPPPALPHVPGSVDDAFDTADQFNPDLAAAIATERQSRAAIAGARATGRPTVTLYGTATLTGRAYPFSLHNDDQTFAGQAVLTIPLTNGGRVGAAVAQAEDRNAADRIGIEAARRQMVTAIVNAWNGIATAERTIEVQTAAVASARVFDEGTFEEYRAGLRSTYDVLYAHATLLNARTTLVTVHRDLYVAEATLLRRIGLLEARTLLTGAPLYDPDATVAHMERRGAVPVWDAAFRATDRWAAPRAIQPGLDHPGAGVPVMAPALAPLPDAQPVTSSPRTPIPGTTGRNAATLNTRAP